LLFFDCLVPEKKNYWQKKYFPGKNSSKGFFWRLKVLKFPKKMRERFFKTVSSLFEFRNIEKKTQRKFSCWNHRQKLMIPQEKCLHVFKVAIVGWTLRFQEEGKNRFSLLYYIKSISEIVPAKYYFIISLMKSSRWFKFRKSHADSFFSWVFRKRSSLDWSSNSLEKNSTKEQ